MPLSTPRLHAIINAYVRNIAQQKRILLKNGKTVEIIRRRIDKRGDLTVTLEDGTKLSVIVAEKCY